MGKQAHLQPKRAEFARLIADGVDPAEAHKMAGYKSKTPVQAAHNLQKNPLVKQAIKRFRSQRMRRLTLTQDEVIRHTAQMAFMDLRALLDDDGKMLPMAEWPDYVAQCVQSVKVVTVGNADRGVGEITEVRLADRNSAADRLFRHLGLYERDNRQRSALEDMPTGRLIEQLRRQYDALQKVLPITDNQ